MTAGDGRLLALYDDLSIPAEVAWRRLALTIHEKACDAAQESPYSHFEVDVFLLVRGRLVEHIPDEDNLKKIVNAARHHTWGGNIYLAWVGASEAEFKSLYQGSELTLENWVRALIDLGVTDLIEIPEEEDKPEPDLYRVLRESASKSEKRLEKLRRFVNDDGWKLILRYRSYQAEAIKTFVKRFVGERQESAEYNNLAVFYDLNRSSHWGELLDQVPKDHDGNLFVAVNSQRIINNLEAVVKRQLPGAELFYFNSTLEWLYSFLRLNPRHRAESRRSTTNPPQDDEAVEWVDAPEGARISSKPNTGDLRLLVTSAFDLKRQRDFDFNTDIRIQEEHCLAASIEIGDVRRTLPFHVAVEVHHSIICERLPDILKDRFFKDRSFTAWLYIGHGRRRGLIDGKTNQLASIDRWTGCFHRYEGNLQLVMFSACESSDLAREFAKLGVPVAIGFENEVLTDAARRLSATVMHEALQTGQRQAAILEVFRDAAVELHRPSYVDINEEGRYEDRHYSDAGPKAFAVKPKSS
jgi:hypothetical protein